MQLVDPTDAECTNTADQLNNLTMKIIYSSFIFFHLSGKIPNYVESKIKYVIWFSFWKMTLSCQHSNQKYLTLNSLFLFVSP